MLIDTDTISRDDIPAALAALAARLVESEPAPTPERSAQADTSDDRLLTTAEAATELRCSTKWMYRHVRQLPFARRMGPRDFRFSLKGLRAWQARQKV